MGRPVNKKHFGTQAGTESTYPNIPVEAAFIGEPKLADSASGVIDVFIVKQKSARRYLVQHKSSGAQAVCRLANKDGSDSSVVTTGEMVVRGYIDGNASNAVNIRSFTNRLATDFNSNRYKWSVTDDSSSNFIVLTAI